MKNFSFSFDFWILRSVVVITDSDDKVLRIKNLGNIALLCAIVETLVQHNVIFSIIGNNVYIKQPILYKDDNFVLI